MREFGRAFANGKFPTFDKGRSLRVFLENGQLTIPAYGIELMR